MDRIYKYPLKVTDDQMVEMPKGAAVLAVQAQRDVPCIWAQVDPDARTIKRRFLTFGTGQPMAEHPQHYIGTYQLRGGDLVFHVFTDRVEYPGVPEERQEGEAP